MTDLVARIEAHFQNDDAGQRWLDSDNLLEEAQARIVELDGFVKTIEDQATALEEENARLNKAIKWEQNWLSRVGTHSEGCWQWGPTHYQCALRHIEELGR